MRLPLAIGAAALLLTSASTALATQSTCTTSVACVVGTNTSTAATTDIGVEGISLHGYGLVGVTSAAPASAATRVAGLYGKDQGPTTFNSGLSGYSLNGVGVSAVGSKGTGLVGATGAVTTAGYGVFGEDNGNNVDNVGAVGASSNGIGLFGVSENSDAVDAYTTATTGIGLNAQGGAGTYPVVQLATDGTGDIVDAYNVANANAPTSEFSVDANGNGFFAGQITTNSTTMARTRSTLGTDVTAYGARTASPTIEDYGQGMLRQGVAHVSLDPTFASTIDTRSYLVFVTPHGDSHGLYTSTPTAGGFDVRENEQGRSTLSFDYRIVGRPLDMASAPHMPAIARGSHFAGSTARYLKIRPQPGVAAFLKRQ